MVKWIWADLETLIDSYSDLGISVSSATLDYGDLTHRETKPISDSVGAPGFTSGTTRRVAESSDTE